MTTSSIATKRCFRCKRTLPVTDFGRDRSSKNGLNHYCKPCACEASRKWYIANSESRRIWYRANSEKVKEKARECMYNLPPDKYDAMLEAQGGVCAICKKPETRIDPRSGNLMNLAVDHGHSCCPGKKSCGKCVRALLCRRCNVRIGQGGDDPDFIVAQALRDAACLRAYPVDNSISTR